MNRYIFVRVLCFKYAYMNLNDWRLTADWLKFVLKSTKTYRYIEQSYQLDNKIKSDLLSLSISKMWFINKNAEWKYAVAFCRNSWQYIQKLQQLIAKLRTPFSVKSFELWSKYWAAWCQTAGWWVNTSRHCSVANITRRVTNAVSSLRSGFDFSKAMYFFHRSTWKNTGNCIFGWNFQYNNLYLTAVFGIYR